MDTKGQILALLEKCKIGVISTFGEGFPESAVVEFAQTPELELVFDTFNKSRKYANIKKNPNISFVIGWEDNITVQYQGVAEELIGDARKPYTEIYFSKNPQAVRWEERKGIAYFKVTPKWVRYSDLNVHPWNIQTLTF